MNEKKTVPSLNVGQVFPLESVLPDVLRKSRKTVAGFFYVPTQVVLKKPGVVVPHQGRFHRTNLYVNKDGSGPVMRYEGLLDKPGFRGTLDYEELVLTEWYENESVEHADYRLAGYVLLMESKLDGFFRKKGWAKAE